MDRIKNLEKAFLILKELDEEFFDSSKFITVAFYIKRLFFLAAKFYPEQIKKYESHVYHLGPYGEICSGTGVLDIEADILPQFMASQSDAIDYITVYYRESPYWEFWFEYLAFDEMENESELSILEFFELRNKVFERKLLDSLKNDYAGHPLKTYYDMFEVSGDYAVDDCVILVSKLLPYYKRIRTKIIPKEMALCNCIDMCERVLTDWLSGFSYEIEGAEYEKAYYISCDNSSYWYEGGYGDGVLEHRLEILIAGELIDRCILELDKRYGFLPEGLRNPKKAEGGEDDKC